MKQPAVPLGRYGADSPRYFTTWDGRQESESDQRLSQEPTGLEIRIFGRNELVEGSDLLPKLGADSTDEEIPGKGHLTEDDDRALFCLPISLGQGGESDVTLLHSRDLAP